MPITAYSAFSIFEVKLRGVSSDRFVVYLAWELQRRLMCAAKKAIGKMPLRTLRSGDEVRLLHC